MAKNQYMLDNQWRDARNRLAQLEMVLDPWTIRNLDRIGVTTGWHCLEIAGGGGSIAEWLCSRVGEAGHVMATDLDIRFLEAIDAPNLAVQRHDVLADAFSPASFDLVHARALLTFLPHPEQAIAKMIAALKPEGWLLVEEPDYISAIPDPSMPQEAIALSQKGWDALMSHLRSRGYDTELGRHLYHDVKSAGLIDVQVEGFMAMQQGGTPSARFWRFTLEQVQDGIVAAGLLTRTELAEYLTLMESTEYRWLSPLMLGVWGRKS